MILSEDYETCTLEASQRFMAARWGWTRSRVRDFLKYLTKNEMITTHQTTHQTTQIKLLNYNKFHTTPTHLSTHQTTQNEEINDLNTKRQHEIEKGIVELCQALTKSNIFPKAFGFAGKMRKESKHPGAILYALTMCAQYKPKNPYPYCKEICDKESPNFNARDYELKDLQTYGPKRTSSLSPALEKMP